MTVVIVGVDIRDAQAIAMTRREGDRGKNVRLVSLGAARHMEGVHGLRVTEIVVSDRAPMHKNFTQVHKYLCRSQLLNGDK